MIPVKSVYDKLKFARVSGEETLFAYNEFTPVYQGKHFLLAAEFCTIGYYDKIKLYDSITASPLQDIPTVRTKPNTSFYNGRACYKNDYPVLYCGRVANTTTSLPFTTDGVSGSLAAGNLSIGRFDIVKHDYDAATVTVLKTPSPAVYMVRPLITSRGTFIDATNIVDEGFAYVQIIEYDPATDTTTQVLTDIQPVYNRGGTTLSSIQFLGYGSSDKDTVLVRQLEYYDVIGFTALYKWRLYSVVLSTGESTLLTSHTHSDGSYSHCAPVEGYPGLVLYTIDNTTVNNLYLYNANTDTTKLITSVSMTTCVRGATYVAGRRISENENEFVACYTTRKEDDDDEWSTTRIVHYNVDTDTTTTIFNNYQYSDGSSEPEHLVHYPLMFEQCISTPNQCGVGFACVGRYHPRLAEVILFFNPQHYVED